MSKHKSPNPTPQMPVRIGSIKLAYYIYQISQPNVGQNARSHGYYGIEHHWNDQASNWSLQNLTSPVHSPFAQAKKEALVTRVTVVSHDPSVGLGQSETQDWKVQRATRRHGGSNPQIPQKSTLRIPVWYVHRLIFTVSDGKCIYYIG